MFAIFLEPINMWTQRFLLCLALIACTLQALALDRPFPPIAKRGTMTPASYPSIIIDGKVRNLSPGAQIRNQDNLIETPMSLRGTGFAVLYTENPQGDIDRIWMLTGEETKRYPTRNDLRD
jgi:hypothetical protein